MMEFLALIGACAAVCAVYWIGKNLNPLRGKFETVTVDGKTVALSSILTSIAEQIGVSAKYKAPIIRGFSTAAKKIREMHEKSEMPYEPLVAYYLAASLITVAEDFPVTEQERLEIYKLSKAALNYGDSCFSLEMQRDLMLVQADLYELLIMIRKKTQII